ELDPVGNVGGVERLDQPARSVVVTGIDSIEDLVDEFGPKPVFLVDRAASGRVRLSEDLGGDGVGLGHGAPLDWIRCRPPMDAPLLVQASVRNAAVVSLELKRSRNDGLFD